MPDIPLDNPQVPDIKSFGFDQNLNRNTYSTPSNDIKSPIVYNPIDGSVNTGQIPGGGSLIGNSLYIPQPSNAKASIDSGGNAIFKSIQVGGSTTQYTLNNNGLFSFGDGSDGAGVADGVGALAGATLAGSIYTLTRDVYFTNLTLSTGVTIKTAGYRIFGTGVLTLNGTAAIRRDGTSGTVGGNASGFTGGAAGGAGSAVPDGYLKGSVLASAGAIGGNGQSGAGSVGGDAAGATTTTNSIGSNGVSGVAGGAGGAGTGFGGGSGGTGNPGGTATASNVKLIANWHLYTLLDISSTGATVKFDNSASCGSAGAGGGGGGDGVSRGAGGGGSGGGGSNGGIIAIYFRSIIIGASATIGADAGDGGAGGNGANATNNNTGGGGGGSGGTGGNGGQVILVYNTLTKNGTITAGGGNAGAKGLKGTGLGTGSNGVDGLAGNAGTAGTIRQFQISL